MKRDNIHVLVASRPNLLCIFYFLGFVVVDFTLPTRIHLTTYPFEHVDIVKLISYFQAKIDVNCELSFDRLGSSTNLFMYL